MIRTSAIDAPLPNGDTPSGRPLRVVHLITDLDIGGAEVMLTRLMEAMDRRVVQNSVVSLKSGGSLAALIRAADVPVFEVGMGPGRLYPALRELHRILRASRPDVLQTWLCHADLAGVIVGAVARVPHVVWNIRCSELGADGGAPAFRWILAALARLSPRPSAVVSNSVAGQAAHERLGYRPRRWALIPNGVDTTAFAPSPGARAEIRRALGLDDDHRLVGLLARLHPMKDHATFLAAAADVARRCRTARFVIAGRGTAESQWLGEMIRSLDLGPVVSVLGERRDAARLLAACDVLVSSSYSEGFPNVVLEAMACAVPCVVTDAGDSAQIVGETGLVVPTRDPQALADAILRIVQMDEHHRAAFGSAGRARAIQEYALPAIAMRYERLYTELSGKPSAPCAG